MYPTILGNLSLWSVISNESSVQAKSDTLKQKDTKRKLFCISCVTVEMFIFY
nr:MAG TPA: hypothetical protein [Caudoviricetes sp.]